MNKIVMMASAAAAVLIASASVAQTPAPASGQGAAARGAGAARGATGAAPTAGAARGATAVGRGAGGGTNGVNPGMETGGAGIGIEENAPLIFNEGWMDIPNEQPITHPHLQNQNMELHIYGDTAGIRASQHSPEPYTYTGETITNWALTLRDPKFYYDLSGNGKMMLRTRNSGYRFTHIVIKTMDGKWYASEEGNPDSRTWINREYAMEDVRWRILLMTDTPSNSSNQRKPDPKLVPIQPMGIGHPDLTKVDEVGYSDLQAGGWIPSTSRVNEWAVYGKKIPR